MSIEVFQRVNDIVRSFDDQEIWRAVEGWGSYFVSSWGRVRGPKGYLKPALVHGYEKVSLTNGTEKTVKTVHRLVAMAFHGEPLFQGAVVAHNDGNQRNNRASNLRWASCKENQSDMVRHNTRVRGSAVEGSKLTEGDIVVIRERIKAREKYGSIADSYSVSKSTIHLIAVNKIWKHVGGSAWQ